MVKLFIMTKQIFIQDKNDSNTYHSLTEVIKIQKVSSGIYDLFFRNGQTIRVSQFVNGTNILDVVELVMIGG